MNALIIFVLLLALSTVYFQVMGFQYAALVGSAASD